MFMYVCLGRQQRVRLSQRSMYNIHRFCCVNARGCVCLCGTAVKSLIEEMKYALTLLERDESACLHGWDERKHIGSGQMEG